MVKNCMNSSMSFNGDDSASLLLKLQYWDIWVGDWL